MKESGKLDTFDAGFEKIRLQQIQDQTLTEGYFNGIIIFGCLAGSNQIDFSSWFFDNEQLSKLKSNNFKELMQPLIENLATYRQLHNILPNQDCILTVKDSNLGLKWLDDESAEKVISDLCNKRHII